MLGWQAGCLNYNRRERTDYLASAEPRFKR